MTTVPGTVPPGGAARDGTPGPPADPRLAPVAGVGHSGPPTGQPVPTDGDQPAALPGDRPAGRARLPARTRIYWQVHASAVGVPIVAAAAAGAWWLDWFTPAIRWAIVAVLAVYLLLIGVLVDPPIRYRLFWYAVSADEIDLQHGFLVVTRTVVPMNRVQFLKTEQGLLEARFGLATLHVHTAAGAVEISGLAESEAHRIRAQIAGLAGLSDDV